MKTKLPAPQATIFGTTQQLNHVSRILTEIGYSQQSTFDPLHPFDDKRWHNCIVCEQWNGEYIYGYSNLNIEVTPHINYKDFVANYSVYNAMLPKWLYDFRIAIATILVMVSGVAVAIFGRYTWSLVENKIGFWNTFNSSIIAFAIFLLLLYILIPKYTKL